MLSCARADLVTSLSPTLPFCAFLYFFVQIHYTTPFLFFSSQHHHLRNRETGINKVIFIRRNCLSPTTCRREKVSLSPSVGAFSLLPSTSLLSLFHWGFLSIYNSLQKCLKFSPSQPRNRTSRGACASLQVLS